MASRMVLEGVLQEARAEESAKTRAEDVLRLLDARDVPLNLSTRKRILACRDLAQVDRWFDRALRAHSLEEVLGEPTRRRTQRRPAKGTGSAARPGLGE